MAVAKALNEGRVEGDWCTEQVGGLTARCAGDILAYYRRVRLLRPWPVKRENSSVVEMDS